MSLSPRPRTIAYSVLFGILTLAYANHARAGFGITPPYVVNDGLARGSEYEQKIVLSRNDPEEDLRVEVTMDVPGAQGWISIDKGFSFMMPKGEMQVPMIVRVNVPDDAKFGEYKGYIRVILAPAATTPGTVGISLGAQIDVRLAVIDQKTKSFVVRSVRLQDLEEGNWWWRYFFPGKIRFGMQVENTGNVRYGPERVVFVIRDQQGKILETTENLNTLQKVKPFEITWVLAELPTRLPPSGYLAQFAIYGSTETPVRSGELSLSVQPSGAIPDYAGGFGFFGLRRREQVELVAGSLGLLALLLAIFWGMRRIIRRWRARSAWA